MPMFDKTKATPDKSKTVLSTFSALGLSCPRSPPVVEKDGDAEGEDGGSDAADNHTEHDEEGIDGRHAAKQDAA